MKILPSSFCIIELT
uniref:Uncharacterized protein n=1 Tax=Rhizophora mucronata TaxID=61149 RepID=A0A2P2Q2J7_RHIMU